MSNGFIQAKIVRRTREAIDIDSFELAAEPGYCLPPFSAGSHIDILTPSETVRQYSLCNDPREGHRYVVAVLRDPKSRGGSRSIHDSLREGDVIRISEPRNHFSLVHDASRSLLFAGGIGVTPILCVAERL